MRLFLLATMLASASGAAIAQQKTTGEVIAEGFARGQQLRQGIDARQQEQSKKPNEPVAAQAPISKSAPSGRSLVTILNSNNGIPRIVILPFKTGNCGDDSLSAATTDKDGNSVLGCVNADPSAGTLIAQWEKYGRRVYDLSEWTIEQSGDADKKALGE